MKRRDFIKTSAAGIFCFCVPVKLVSDQNVFNYWNDREKIFKIVSDKLKPLQTSFVSKSGNELTRYWMIKVFDEKKMSGDNWLGIGRKSNLICFTSCEQGKYPLASINNPDYITMNQVNETCKATKKWFNLRDYEVRFKTTWMVDKDGAGL